MGSFIKKMQILVADPACWRRNFRWIGPRQRAASGDSPGFFFAPHLSHLRGYPQSSSAMPLGAALELNLLFIIIKFFAKRIACRLIKRLMRPGALMDGARRRFPARADVRAGRDHRKTNLESGPLAWFAFDLDRSAVRFCDAVADRQAQA